MALTVNNETVTGLEGFYIIFSPPEPKQSQWLITTNVHSTINQRKLDANSCNRHQGEGGGGDEIHVCMVKLRFIVIITNLTPLYRRTIWELIQLSTPSLFLPEFPVPLMPLSLWNFQFPVLRLQEFSGALTLHQIESTLNGDKNMIGE